VALTEKVTFLLGVNAKGVAQEFDKVGRAADRSLGKAETRSEQLQATFTKVGAGMLAAGALATAALYGMAQDASSMAETVDKAAILFGDGFDQVIEFSEGAAKSIGVAKDQALDAASTFAIYGKRAGLAGTELATFSTDLVKAAADMASFNDASLEDTIAAIGAGLRGESEPLQRFGVDTRVAALEAAALEAGLIGVGEKLSANEQPMAVMAAITQQAADQMGNFALTQDSAANQAKQAAAEFQNMRLELGEAALPILRDATSALNTMVGAFNSLPDPMKSAIAQGAVWGTGLLLVGGAVLSVAGRVQALSGAIRGLHARFPAATGAAGKFAVGMAGVVLAFDQYQKHAAETEAKTQAVADAFRDGAPAADQWKAAIEGIIAADGGMLAERLDRYGLTIDEVRQAWSQAAGDGEAFYSTLAGLGEGVDVNGLKFTNLFGVLESGFEGLEQEGRRAQGTTDRLSEDVRILGERASSAAGGASELAAGLGSTLSPAAELEEVMDRVNSRLDDFFGSIQSRAEVQSQFEAAMDDATAAIAEHGATLDLDTQAGRDNLDLRGQLIASIDAMVDAMVESGATTDQIRDKTQQMIDRFLASVEATGASGEAVDGYTEALERIPDAVVTQLEQSGYDEVAANAAYIEALYDRLDGRTVVTYFTTPGLAPQPGGGGGSSDDEEFFIPGADSGGRSARKFRDSGSGGWRDGFAGGQVPVQLVMRDGRVIADVVIEEGDRRGGLPLLIRGAG
jgi:hypothetical protein